MPLVRPVAAPRCCTSDESVALMVIAAASDFDLDLAQQPLYPAWSPQKLTLTAATALAVVMTDEDGKAHTITVPAAGVVVISRPIRLLTKAGSGAVQVIAEWFD